MSDDAVKHAIANELWRSWKHGSLPFWCLVFLIIGAVVGPDRQPSPSESERRQETCRPILWSTVAGDPARESGWEALKSVGWEERRTVPSDPETARLVDPSC